MDGLSREAVFLATHRPQLQVSGVPERYWNILSKKINEQIYDASETFSLMLIDYEDMEKQPHDSTRCVQVISENGININDPTQIYLIDHAWTFRTHLARRQLRSIPGLLDRMFALTGVEVSSNASIDDKVEAVFDSIWKFAQFYSLNTENISTEDSLPIWYIMDELGSGIQHSDEPNFKCVPFVHLVDQTTYSLLFPLKNVKEGDIVTINFIENISIDDENRLAMLLPWQEFDSGDDVVQIEPDAEYFLSGHIEETLPDKNHEIQPLDCSRKVKVYSTYQRIIENLTRSEFEIVDDPLTADILWYTDHFKSFREFSIETPDTFINQFPFENVVNIKDLLSIVCRRKSDNPIWLPKTFNLKTELVKFVAYYRHRQSLNVDNHWICKPFNLARSLDTHITDNLNFIVRLPTTGPKIAQKYIENPVLFTRLDNGLKVKFDIRYVILLKSVKPLQVYVYKNFFLRFSNRAFAMDNFDEYEQHFTVMNYNENSILFRMLCDQFVAEWSQQYKEQPWSDVEEKMMKMLREVFECATMKSPPCGIAQSKQSRALYAADIMLAWDKDDVIQPKLLEINWMPDCNRACQYYPHFYNDIFGLLFLDEKPDSCKAL